MGLQRERWAQFRDGTGRVRCIPASWTSMGDEDPLLTLAGDRAYLRADDLLRLADLLDRLNS